MNVFFPLTFASWLNPLVNAPRRPSASSLAETAATNTTRSHATVAAYATGEYSYQQIADFFNLHFTTIGNIVPSARAERYKARPDRINLKYHMRYRKLGTSHLNVSEICLGTMTFGEQNSEAEGHAQLDMALDWGVNFIDTAEMYSIPPRAKTYGRTEAIIGNWLKKTGNRDRVILASKVIGQADSMPYIRNAQARLDRKNIEQAIEGSLHRLKTDYLDLYQVHWPDRKTNFFGKLGYPYSDQKSPTSIAETLGVLADLVKTGKVRYIGVSNETPWGVMEYLRQSEKLNLPRIVSIQNPYNLLNRSYEIGLAEISHQEQVGLLAYSPLGFGVLSGKYINQQPKNTRLCLFPEYKRYSNENGVTATNEYVKLAKKYHMSATQMALAYINSRPFIGAYIIGATKLTQLKENLGSAEITLSAELLAEIELIHQRYANPCP